MSLSQPSNALRVAHTMKGRATDGLSLIVELLPLACFCELSVLNGDAWLEVLLVFTNSNNKPSFSHLLFLLYIYIYCKIHVTVNPTSSEFTGLPLKWMGVCSI